MGLMQLMPNTVDEIVERGPFSPAYREQPFDPGMNIHMGSSYLAALKRENTRITKLLPLQPIMRGQAM